MLISGLVILLLLSVVFTSLTGKKSIRIALSILFGLFWCAQLSSVYIGGSFINYRYYLHFDIKSLAMASAFKWEAVAMVVLLAGLPVALYYGGLFLHDRLASSGKIKTAGFYILSIVCLSGMLALPSDSMYKNLADAIAIVTTHVEEENEISRQLTPKAELQVNACTGKNIVIISLESFEKAFLHPINRHLTPHLQQRATQWAFRDMHHTSETGFTIGSLYTVFTGMPPLFAGSVNMFFHGAASNKLISLADIVMACGYETYHFSNNATFAGTRDLLTALGVQHVWDDLEEKKYPPSPMSGAYDKDIFNEAKEVILHRMDKPFMMFIATTQTHRPNGFVDDRLLDVVEPGTSSLETSAKCTDWLVEDFLQFLEAENLLDNTAVYIFPDHAFWGGKDILDRTGEGYKLWVMTNTHALDNCENELYQIDLPKLILHGAGIQHNAVFLSDLAGKSPNAFIEQHLQTITALNTASIVREKTLGESFTLTKRWGRLECRINDEVVFKERMSRLRNKHITIAFDENLKFQPPKVYSNEEFADGYYDPNSTYIDIHCRGRRFDFCWSSDDLHSYRREGLTKLSLTSDDIISIQRELVPRAWNTFDPIDKVNPLAHAQPPFEGCLLDYLPQAMQDSNKLLLAYAYDEASIHAGKAAPLFQSLGLKETLAGKFRWAYAAALTRDSVYFEKARPDVLHKKLRIAGNSIAITSRGGNQAPPDYANMLLINDREYAYPHRGLNFVLYDLSAQRAIDAFHVDFYDDETLTVRR